MLMVLSEFRSLVRLGFRAKERQMIMPPMAAKTRIKTSSWMRENWDLLRCFTVQALMSRNY